MIDVKFFLDNPTSQEIGENITGKIGITAQEDFSFNRLFLKLKFERRGYLQILGKETASFTIASGQTFRKGAYHEFEFTLNPPEQVISFKGKYLQIRWFLETEVELTEESKKQTRNKNLLNFKLFKAVNVEKVFKVRKALNVTNEKFPLRVGYQKREMRGSFNIAGIGIAFFIAFIFFSIFMGANAPLIFVVIPGLILLGAMVYFIKERFFGAGQLGKIQFEIQPKNDTHFELKFSIEENDYKVEAVNFSYRVKEKVIDRRGTSTETNTGDLYIWENNELEVFKFKMIKIEIPYPSKVVPATFSFDDCSVYYELQAGFVMKNGMTSRRVGIFEVGYEDLK